MKKIKVLRIVARLNIGGPAIHTVLLSEALDKNAFETLLLAGKPGDNEGDMLYLAQDKGVQPIIIPELGRSLSLFNDAIAFWKIFSVIKKERPDIVHTHTAKAGALGRLAVLLYKCLNPRISVKLIHTFHGHVLHSYFGRIKSLIFIWIERFLAKFTYKIIAVSDNVKEELIRLGVGDNEKIVTIPLGLELEKFFKIKRNGSRTNDRKTIAIIGRLVPVKNQKMFLDIAKEVRDILGVRQKVRFFVIGDGPLRKELEDYAHNLGINEDVSFTGWVPDLENIYSKIDIVALTSLNEGTPVALIEAQAAACPCVATNVGGVADVIAEDKSGFLVPGQDKERFVECLLKLLQEPSLISSMGEYGRQALKGKFSKERLVRDIEQLYQQETASN